MSGRQQGLHRPHMPAGFGCTRSPSYTMPLGMTVVGLGLNASSRQSDM